MRQREIESYDMSTPGPVCPVMYKVGVGGGLWLRPPLPPPLADESREEKITMERS